MSKSIFTDESRQSQSKPFFHAQCFAGLSYPGQTVVQRTAASIALELLISILTVFSYRKYSGAGLGPDKPLFC